MFVKQASRRMIPRNMLLYKNIGRHWNKFSLYEYFPSALSLSLICRSVFTFRTVLAASCRKDWTKCKITVMMSLLFGNVSDNSIWLELCFFGLLSIPSWLFSCFVFCFYFILFNFFRICSCCSISKGLKLSRTKSMYFFVCIAYTV